MQGTRAMFEQQAALNNSASPRKPAWKTDATLPKPSTPAAAKPSQTKPAASTAASASSVVKTLDRLSDEGTSRPPRANKPSVGNKPARSSADGGTSDQPSTGDDAASSSGGETLSSVQAAKKALGLQQPMRKGPPLKNVDSSGKPSVHLKPVTADKPTTSSARSSALIASESTSQSGGHRQSKSSVSGFIEDDTNRSSVVNTVACSINEELASKFLQKTANKATEEVQSVKNQETSIDTLSRSKAKKIANDIESRMPEDFKSANENIENEKPPIDSEDKPSNQVISKTKLIAEKLKESKSSRASEGDLSSVQTNGHITTNVDDSTTSPPLLVPPRRHSKRGEKSDKQKEVVSTSTYKPAGSIVVDKQGRRYKKLAKPKPSQTDKIPRKLARPPNVDLSQYLNPVDKEQGESAGGIRPAVCNGTHRVAAVEDDDEIYDDATSATETVPVQQEQKQQNSQYVEGLTRVMAPPHATRGQPMVAAVPTDDSDSDMEEIYEEI